MQKPKLIIFDIDGTLAAFNSTEPLPGVREWFDAHYGEQTVILCSNQGGVGLREWMQSGNFGQPEKYPTKADVQARMAAIRAALGVEPRTLVCYRYQAFNSKKWCPIPADVPNEELIYWQQAWRKPEPGMLIYAMELAGVKPEETLMVGDMAEDELAAQAAWCSFEWAEDFFQRVQAR
jgi:HAD superfamily hydrolase (TIGR01662 family)